MSLVGTTLLGNTFVQDPKPQWIKIDNVAIGESKKYSYKTIKNGDIGALLDQVSSDTNVVCVVYNWTDGKAYLKSGFNLGVSSDYKLATGFTTFVLVNKISNFWSPVKSPKTSRGQKTNPVVSTPAVPSSNGFVTYSSSQGNFVLNGSKFVPIGFNAYWLGFTEDYSYPSNSEIDEMFSVATTMKATVIRSHTLGFSSGSSNSLRPNSNTLNASAWAPIDYAFYKATQSGIKLICPLTDAYNYFNGNYGDYCNTRNLDKTVFFTDINVRNDFKNYISQWLNHTNSYTNIQIKNSPEIFCIELGNELGNIRPDSGSTVIPTQEWITDISVYIKSIDQNHLVMSCSDECLGGSISNDFEIPSIDVFSAHFYGEDYTRIDYGANSAAAKGKPYIIGECSSGFGSDFTSQILSRPNVKGCVFWGMYPHLNGSEVVHDDGYTLHYPEDSTQLKVWSDYFSKANA
jgi:hypothetical protein